MKKKLLITSLAIYSVAINAQITITSADMPVVGNSYITANDTAVTSYGTAGANQTWNFSSWGNTSLDTMSFQSPSGVPSASYFPTATLASGDVESGYSFMQISSTSAEILGFAGDFGGGDVVASFIPTQKLLTFPSTYQTAFNNASAFELSFASTQLGVDSIKIKNSTNTTSVIDGWGILSTPAYSNVNTLRQFDTEVSNDSIFAILTGDSVWINVDNSLDTSYIYRWWSNAHTYTVAEITFDEGDSIYTGSYLTNTLVGVNEIAEKTSAVSVFPSPATDKLNFIGIDANSYLIIFDVNGKIVDKVFVKKNTTVNVANYNNGVYFYTVAPLNGSAVSQGKFVVQK